MQAGIVPRDKYESIDACNWSTLKNLLVSGAYYQHCLKNPRRDTPAFALGRGAHTAIFEPDRFPLEYVIKPDGMERRSNAGKAAYAAMESANVGKTILDADDYRDCLSMRDALMANPLTARYLGPGRSEVPIVWRDPESGVWCKARLDRLSDLPALPDLKTTRSVDEDSFGRDAAKYLYYGQMAHYRNGCRVLGLLPPEAPTVILAVEKAPPFDTAVFHVGGSGGCMLFGQETVASLLVKLKHCRETNEWRGRYQEERVLTLPPWVYEDDDMSDLDFGEGAAT